MAQPAATDNVLTTLDDRVPTAFYWQLTLLAKLGGFLFGYDTSNIGSALNFVPYNLHGLALGYLVSGASLGAAAGAILAGPLSDHFGRKTLLVIDAGIYAAGAILSAVTWHAAVLLTARTLIVFALVAALGLAFTSGTLRLVVIMIGLDFFIASFAIGVGGTGWTLQGEVFPTAVRGQAAAFCAMIDWLANFLLIEVFPVWQNAISLSGVLVCFAALAALAIVFIWKFLPETKGLAVEDIVKLFEQNPSSPGIAPAATAADPR
jgi:MFS family permease